MSSVTKAMFDRMRHDSVLNTLLPKYNGYPTIFTSEPAPPEAPLPLVLTTGFVTDATDVPEHSKQRIASRPVRDIRCYDEGTGSMARIEAIAERVWELFHLAKFPVEGWGLIRCRAARPVFFEADGHTLGVVVTVTMAIQKPESIGEPGGGDFGD